MAKQHINKIDELCVQLYLTKEFQKRLKEIRKNYNIPPDGFNTEQDYAHWMRKNFKTTNPLLTNISIDLAKEYKLPPQTAIRMKEVVLFGLDFRPDNFDLLMDLDEFVPCDIDIHFNRLNEWKHNTIPVVNIIISDFASRDEVLVYIKKHWKQIQNFLDLQRDDKPKPHIRAIRNRNLIEKVLILNSLSPDELRKGIKNKLEKLNKRKSSLIASYLKQNTSFKIGSAGVKKIIEKHAKTRRR